jgi:putative hemolysin
MAKKRVRPKKSRKLLPVVILVTLLIVSIVFLYALISSNASSMAAASAKCLKDGGQERIISGTLGESGLCLFPDGSVCDELAYSKGACNKGECMRSCGAMGTRSEGWYDCRGKLLFYDNCTGENPKVAGSC